MRKVLLVFSFIIALSVYLSAMIGCGYNPDDPPYDTKANPDHFPKAALILLDNLESGEITSLTDITEGFGDLYSSQTSLLDNEKWKDVIVRLGAKFAQVADDNKERGIGFYLKASEYYLLASFARPADDRLRKLAALFGGWLAAYSDPSINFDSLVVMSQEELSSALWVAKRFLLGDDQQREFFDIYLSDQLKNKLTKAGKLNDKKLVSLSDDDHALAHAAGFSGSHWEREKIATFISPSNVQVDLLAGRVDQIDSNKYKIELYFLPHKQLATDMVVALNLRGDASEFPEFSQEQHFLPVRVEPKLSTSEWGKDKVIGVVREFNGYSKIKSMFIGIADAAKGNQDNYFKLSGVEKGNTHIPLNSDLLNLWEDESE